MAKKKKPVWTLKPIRYPWDRWFGKSKFRIVRGKHFYCATYCMAGQVRNAAVLYDVKVSIKVKEDTLVVTVHENT